MFIFNSAVLLSLLMILGLTVYRTASTEYGEGTGLVFLSGLGCNGSEHSLLECPHSLHVGSYCTHARDVGVRCERT